MSTTLPKGSSCKLLLKGGAQLRDRTAYFREYARKNRDKRKANLRSWAAANRDRVNAYAREWQAAKRRARGIAPRGPRTAAPKPKANKKPKPIIAVPRDGTLRDRFMAYRQALAHA